jgi:hypothetical protein
MRRIGMKAAISFLAISGSGWGHIDTLKMEEVIVATHSTSIDPGPTNRYFLGRTVTLTWSVTNTHGGAPFLLQYSGDNGTTWDSVGSLAGSNSTGTRSLQWTMIRGANQARLRLFQRAGQPFSGTSNDYNLVSGTFFIAWDMALPPVAGGSGLSLRESPGTLDVAIPGVGLRLVEFANLDGRVLRTVPAGGRDHVRLPLAGLPAGRAALRLRTDGGAVHSRIILFRP